MQVLLDGVNPAMLKSVAENADLKKHTMKLRGKPMSEKGSILAVSEDKGSNWKFVRVKSKESIRPLFPKAVDKLTFPETIVK